MTNDVTLSKLPTTADRVWTVVVEDGVEVTWMKDAAEVDQTKITKVDANTYQVPESAEVNGIKVKSANTSGAIATNDTTCMLASDASTWTVAKGAANDGTISLNTLDKGQTIYVYAASKITLADSLTGAEFSPNLGTETTVWARPGVTLTIYADGTNGDGIIVQYGTTDQFAGFNPDKGEFKVDNRDITLRQGWKVTLNGVTATIEGSTEVVESGMRVANGKQITLTIAQKDGKAIATNIIEDMTGNYDTTSTAETLTSGAVDKTISARHSYTAVTKVTIAGQKEDITVSGTDSATGLPATIAKGPSGTTAVDIYVLPGQTITVDAGTNTLTVKDSENHDVTEGVKKGTSTAEIVVGATDLVLSY